METEIKGLLIATRKATKKDGSEVVYGTLYDPAADKLYSVTAPADLETDTVPAVYHVSIEFGGSGDNQWHKLSILRKGK